eukprot:364938-Chlamydomonas_euryale.AAC.25
MPGGGENGRRVGWQAAAAGRCEEQPELTSRRRRSIVRCGTLGDRRETRCWQHRWCRHGAHTDRRVPA